MLCTYAQQADLLYRLNINSINSKHSYWDLSQSKLTLPWWPSGQGVGLVTRKLGVLISVEAHFFLQLLRKLWRPISSLGGLWWTFLKPQHVRTSLLHHFKVNLIIRIHAKIVTHWSREKSPSKLISKKFKMAKDKFCRCQKKFF